MQGTVKNAEQPSNDIFDDCCEKHAKTFIYPCGIKNIMEVIQMARRKIRLLVVGEDFDLIRSSYSTLPKYRYSRLIVPIYPYDFDFKKIKKIVEEYNSRYPDKRLKVLKRKIFGKTFIVIRREGYSYSNPPVYLCVNDGRIYVPASYVRRNKRLVSAVVHYRMSLLGLRYRTCNVVEEE